MDTRSKSRPRRRIIIESDDDDDAEFRINECIADDVECDEFSTSANEDKSLQDDLGFDATEGFDLKPMKATKLSQHPIWKRFGVLMKTGKPVDRLKDRIFCVVCFENEKFKR